MSDERMRVLEMVRDGKITAEEGARLLEALKASAPPAEEGRRREDPFGGIVDAVSEALSRHGFGGWGQWGSGGGWSHGPLAGLRRKEERQAEGWEFINLSDGDHGTFEIAPGARLRVEAEAGPVDAVATDDAAARVELDAGHAYNFGVYAARKGEEVVVASYRTAHEARLPRLRVSVPRGVAHVTARTSGGGITARGFSCPVSLKTGGGGIRATEQGSGRVDAHTSGGGIEVDGTPETVELHTSGGGIVFRGQTNSLDAKTSGGGITIDGARLTGGQHRVKTAGGGIRVRLTPDSSVSLDASTSAGKIRVDLPGVEGEMSGSRISPHYRGVFNGGGGHLEMRTSAGGVSIELAGDAESSATSSDAA